MVVADITEITEGVQGYYPKFILHYGFIAKPLTVMLKKENFYWTPKAIVVFQALKEALLSEPVLILPNSSLFLD